MVTLVTLQNRRKKIEVVRSEVMSERRVHNGYVSENARVLHGYTRELEIKGKRNLSHYSESGSSCAVLRIIGKPNAN